MGNVDSNQVPTFQGLKAPTKIVNIHIALLLEAQTQALRDLSRVADDNNGGRAVWVLLENMLHNLLRLHSQGALESFLPPFIQFGKRTTKVKKLKTY